MLRFLLLIFCSLPSALLLAQAAAENIQAPLLEIRIKPSLCLRYATGESCELELEVVWKSVSPGDFCLYTQGAEGPLQCWRQLTEGNHFQNRRIDSDVEYWLSFKDSDEKLVSSFLKLATVVENEKRSRSGRRHVWNLI